MAAAFPPSPSLNEVPSPVGHGSLAIVYPHDLASMDLDSKDGRYPSLPKGRPHSIPLSNGKGRPWSGDVEPSRQFADDNIQRKRTWKDDDPPTQDGAPLPQQQNIDPTSGLPPGADSFAERYGLDDKLQIIASPGPYDPANAEPPSPRSTLAPSRQSLRHQQQNSQGHSQELQPPQIQQSLAPSAPRHPSLPAAGVGAGFRTSVSVPGPIIPLSAAPSYSPPVSSQPRAYAQQPTYVPAPAPAVAVAVAASPLNPIYSPKLPKEDECIECATRDADMADVDVTSPGVWDRESDVWYEELVRREKEDAAHGRISSAPGRPRAKGGRLTEVNLKIWLSVNPKEPQARKQTLDSYVKTQVALLAAEAIARARTMQETRELDNKMRDAYAQLRRSAYDLGNSVSPVDDTGGVRIKIPREAVLHENGMIVEHVDVRREEREERERRRKEERRERSRARRTSKSSVALDVGSVHSAQLSPGLQYPDSGFFTHDRDHQNQIQHQHQRSSSTSQYSQSQVTRPSSLLTTPSKLSASKMYSQPSFSDAQSVGSSNTNNRRSRFLDFRSWNGAWASRDSLAPSGFSGSMVDMHVALDREKHRGLMNGSATGELSSNAPTLRITEKPWSREVISPSPVQSTLKPTTGKPKKVKKGLAKMWKIFTGSASKSESNLLHGHPHPNAHAADLDSKEPKVMSDRSEDDLPLAPPPPISYLVNRTSGDRVVVGPERGGGMSTIAASRHVSINSSPSTPSANNRPLSFSTTTLGASPLTAPSSVLPSPSSSRMPHERKNSIDGPGPRKSGFGEIEMTPTIDEEMIKMREADAQVRPMVSEPDLRRQSFIVSPNGGVGDQGNLLLPSGSFNTGSLGFRPMSMISVDKELPPLPPAPEPSPLHTSKHLPPLNGIDYPPPANDFLVAPQAPFRSAESRRQSFDVAPRPKIALLRTMPATSTYDGPLTLAGGGQYDEFAVSRQSLGRLDDNTAPPTPSTSKRRSKFGLASLIGKKPAHHKQSGSIASVGQFEFPVSRSPESDGRHESSVSGYDFTSRSGHSFNAAQRISVNSRKPLEELVQQEPEFVAYRYPSGDERLDLLR